MSGSSRADLPLRLSPRAQRDLDEIYDYYAAHASTEIAEMLLSEIGSAAVRVARRPMLGRSRDDLLPGMRSVPAAPYLIFYRAGRDAVEIVRVLHQRRDLKAVLKKEEP